MDVVEENEVYLHFGSTDELSEIITELRGLGLQASEYPFLEELLSALTVYEESL